MPAHLARCLLLLFLAAVLASGQGSGPLTFRRIALATVFVGEGPAVGDYNRDGSLDVAAGPFWFEGPAFTVRRKFGSGADSYDPNTYSPYYMALPSHDLNRDGWTDIVMTTGAGYSPTYWYENPKGGAGAWKRTLLNQRTGHEAAQMVDLFGDGRLRLLNIQEGRLGWGQADAADPYKVWDFHPISDAAVKYVEFEHGLGIGDLDGDGRKDITMPDGFYLQGGSAAAPTWTRKEYPFKENSRGGSQMHMADVDGDGDMDVVSSLNGHGWGLAWFEQVKDASGGLTFKTHKLMGTRAEEAQYGAAFSQLHSLAFADLDGDGLKDIVTGKRFWAHNNTNLDPELNGAAVLYWFQCVRSASGATFRPFLIDSIPGSGTNLEVADLDKDGVVDVAVSSKKGATIYLTRRPNSVLKPGGGRDGRTFGRSGVPLRVDILGASVEGRAAGRVYLPVPWR